jgi:hypothetical protein
MRRARAIAAKPSNNSRAIGAAWVLLSPGLFLMAAISTVKSEAFYMAQLVAFAVVAVVGFVSGVGLTIGRVWARKVIELLSWIASLYLFGSAVVLAFCIPQVFWDRSYVDGLLVTGVVVAIAVTATPFVLMARALRRDAISSIP